MSQLSTLGKQIDAARERRGLSWYHVAKHANMDYSQLYRTLRSTTSPKRDSLLRICRSLGCSLAEAAEIFSTVKYLAPTFEELEEHPALIAS